MVCVWYVYGVYVMCVCDVCFGFHAVYKNKIGVVSPSEISFLIICIHPTSYH